MEKIPEFIANHLFLVCLFISILILLIWNLFGTAIMGLKSIGTAELTRLINHEDAMLIDLRKDGEFKNGHISNAQNLPSSEFDKKIDSLASNKEKPIVLYCSHGSDTVRHARLLIQNGFKQVYSLQGGITSWTQANLPLNKK